MITQRELHHTPLKDRALAQERLDGLVIVND